MFQAGGPRKPVSDFMLKYLSEKFTDIAMVAEWCYYINDACQRYNQDDKLKLFGGCLSGEVCVFSLRLYVALCMKTHKSMVGGTIYIEIKDM